MRATLTGVQHRSQTVRATLTGVLAGIAVSNWYLASQTQQGVICTLLRDRRRGLLQVGNRSSLVRRTALEVLAMSCRANGRLYVLMSTPLMAIVHY
jgi:hypothetical protein